MKKLSILLAAAFGLFAAASCQKEQTSVVETKGNAFEIIANLPKTSLDGYTVSWVDGDKISVCMDGTAAKEWKTGKEFTYDAGTGKFSSASGLSIKDTTCFFNVLYGDNTQYSYHKNTGTTFKLTDSQLQDCANPTAHLANLDALAGCFEFTAPAEGGQMTSAVTIDMHHVFTLMEIDLINDSGAEINASSLTLAAANDIAGVCKIDYLAEPYPAISAITSSAKKAIKVNITGGVIPDKGTLPVYLVMVPLAEYTGDITLTVNDAVNGSVYEKTVSLSGVNFEAGKLNKTNYTLKTGTTIQYKTIAEARAAESEFSANLNIKDLQVMATGASSYFVKDASGSMYVFATPGTIVPGEKITITGATTTTYKEFRQITSSSVSRDGVDTPSYPEPTVLDATSFDALGTSLGSGSGFGEYCKFSGTLTISGNYYNIAVAGASKVGAIVKPNADLLPLAVSGNNVEITGYSLYLSGNYVYFIATDIKKGISDDKISVISEKTIQVGNEWNMEASSKSGLAISYESSAPAIATVDQTGKVTAVAEGEAIITLSTAGSAEYNPCTATCKVTVSSEPVTTKYYVKVTSAPTKWDGKYLIVYEAAKDTCAMKGSETDGKTMGGNGTKVALTVTKSGVEYNANTQNEYFEIKSVTGGYSIQSKSGLYIYGKSKTNGLQYATTWAATYANTISLSDGLVTISTIDTDVQLRANTGNGLFFRFYKNSTVESSSSYKQLALYKLED